MTTKQRKQLAEKLESVLIEALRSEGVLVNGTMLNRIETFAVAIAEIARVKELAETR